MHAGTMVFLLSPLLNLKKLHSMPRLNHLATLLVKGEISCAVLTRTHRAQHLKLSPLRSDSTAGLRKTLTFNKIYSPWHLEFRMACPCREIPQALCCHRMATVWCVGLCRHRHCQTSLRRTQMTRWRMTVSRAFVQKRRRRGLVPLPLATSPSPDVVTTSSWRLATRHLLVTVATWHWFVTLATERPLHCASIALPDSGRSPSSRLPPDLRGPFAHSHWPRLPRVALTTTWSRPVDRALRQKRQQRQQSCVATSSWWRPAAPRLGIRTRASCVAVTSSWRSSDLWHLHRSRSTTRRNADSWMAFFARSTFRSRRYVRCQGRLVSLTTTWWQRPEPRPIRKTRCGQSSVSCSATGFGGQRVAWWGYGRRTSAVCPFFFSNRSGCSSAAKRL